MSGEGSGLHRPQTLGGVFFLAVAACTAVGLTIVGTGPWRTGLAVIGAGILAGAVVRLVLPDDAAGMLKVRRKLVDVVTLAGLGAALVVLSVVIPDAGAPL